ncbi:hypothetical protein [uncultured Duncaniella sp.]|uniref:hypothetical protein n=1 Tax=uncultured Duncaniella sp. TaxID=2768039 RepID=UPI0025E6C974|nr:hypothetical protein [uncultured Duncaniella sp.]
MACRPATLKPVKPGGGGRICDYPADMTLTGLIAFYNDNFAAYLSDEALDRLSTTIDFICGKDNGGVIDGEKYIKDSHQRRMTAATVRAAYGALDSLDARQFNDFEALVEEVERLIGEKRVKGFGRLAVYDFALRYGHSHGIKPKKFVYIQQGARDGALGLREAGYLSFANSDRKIPVEAFPAELRALGAMHIENFLCDMKNYLRALKKHN